MPQQGQNPTPYELWDMFQQSQIATILNNISVRSLSMTTPGGSKIGAALAPGPTYVGGSSLVVWRNARNPKQAVDLIRHLTSNEIQLQFSLFRGYMPSRSNILNDVHFTKTPNLRVFSQSIFLGRTYSNMPLVGLKEDLFATVIGNVWSKIISNPEIDIKATLLAEVEAMLLQLDSLK